MLLAFGGICTALSLICLFLGGVISINTFALMALASVFTGIMYIEGGIKYSVITFVSVSILAFLLPVDKMSFIYYLGFFGYYPIAKGLIERFDKLGLEILVKTILFLVVSFAGIYTINKIMGIKVSELLPWQLVSLAGIVVFHIYDYALSIFFDFYKKRIRVKIKR